MTLEQARKFWDQVHQNANPPEPTPTGRQVVEAFHAEMTVNGMNKMLESSPVRIDDRPGKDAERVVAPAPGRRLIDGYLS